MKDTLRKLKLLLWKNFTLKKRQPLVLTFEIIWPLTLMIIEAIVRQSHPPVNQQETIYIPRGMPSAGLIPFLQGAVCDPAAVSHPKDFNGSWNDTNGFYDFNPAISALLRNATLMLHDPDFNLSRLSRFQHDLERLQTDLVELNRTLLSSSDPQKVGQAIGLPSWSGASTIQLNEIVKNGSDLKNFLIHQLNFSSVDADSFLSSSIDVPRLQLYALERATQYSQCLVNPFQCGVDLGGIPVWNGDLSRMVDAVQSAARGSQQLSTQELLLNSGLLKQLACDKTGAFQRVFIFPKLPVPTESEHVQRRLCDLTGQQSAALANELNKDLDIAKLQQRFRPPNSTSLYQQYQNDIEKLREDNMTLAEMEKYLAKMEQYLGGPIRQIVSSFPPNLTLTNMTSAQQTKLFVCTLCGETGDRCDAASTKPLQGHRWSKAHDETSVAGRLLQGVQILYAPNTPSVQRVIHEANQTFDEIEKLLEIINDVVESQKDLSLRVPNSTFARSAMNVPCRSLRSPGLSSVTSANCSVEPLLGVMKRVSIKWIGFDNETELEKYAMDQSSAGTEVWAGVVFKNVKANESLGKDVRYTIRMNESMVVATDSLRRRYWIPGPETYRTHTTYETFGFTYIQDMVDRGIVNVLTNKTVIEPGGYLQRFPYPCYIHDRFSTALSATLPLFMALAWVLSVSMVIRNVVYEKEERMKELMKIMGLTSMSLWLSWFITSLIIMGTSALILTTVMKLGGILLHSNFLIVFLFFLNFASATIMLCFIIATLFNKANLAALSGGLLYMFTYLPFIVYFNYEAEYGFSQKAGLSLLSTTAFGVACSYLARFEEQGIGLQWNNVGSSVLPGDGFSFLTANAFIFLDTILYAIIVWYIDNVFPGQYGVPRPWYFLFQKSYWKGVFGCTKIPSKQTSAKRQTGYTTIPLNAVGEDETSTKSPSIYVEADPTHLPIGVSIQNLVKVYGGKKRAVDNLTLNFYEGQITSFLGHNGAGKTTTMSVLCGLFPPSSGTAYIKGMDIACDIDEIRKTLGFCPQQNTLYNKMTVAEHLWFFAKMKNVGVPDKKLKQEVDKWINELNLTAKRNARVGSLSGGMKRKLSVAMAYVGDSKVVILDEPTAGVDPYARRGIWDLMFKHRETRTVLLSTHYMDEADVLGDRIAIISHGKLCCVGSSLYLKHQLSDGYYLTLAKQRQGSATSLALSAVSGLASSSWSASCDISGSLPTLSSSRLASLASSESMHATGISDDVFSSSDARKPSGTNGCTHRRNRSEGSAIDFVPGLSRKKGSKKNLNYSCVTENVTRLIQSHIPSAQLMEDIGSELTYLLPTKEGSGYELSLLLGDLDRQKAGLGIASYGMSDTSLEEVFLKVTNEAEEAQPDPTTGTSLLNRLRRKRWRWSKRKKSSSSLEDNVPLVSDTGDESDEEDSQSEEGPLEESGIESGLEESREADCYGDAGNCTVTGYFLLLQQYKALFIKRFHHSRRYFKGFIAQVVLPAIFICVALVFKLLAPTPSNGTIELTPRTYPGKLYIPFENFNPSEEQAVQMTLALGQPCGVSAYYLTAGLDQTRCHEYLNDTESHRHPYWTKPSNATPPVNATCSCSSGKQQCPNNIVAPQPPSLDTVDYLTLQDLADKKNMTDYILKSTDDYILHRYGGVSFGHENDQYAAASPGPYDDFMQLLGVRQTAKAWYTNKGYHSPPIYLNVLNNAILRGNLDPSENITQYGITTYSHPFNKTIIQLIEDKMRSGIDLLIALCVIFALSFVPPSFLMFLIRERATGAKHQQLVCGVNPVIYWIANYCWDMCNYMVTVLFIVIIFYAFGEDVYTSGDNFSAIIVMFILHGWAMIPLMYPATYMFTNSSTAYIVTMAISVLIGFVTTSTTLILQLIEQAEGGGTSGGGLSDQLRVAFLIFPNYCLGRGLMDMAFNYYITTANKELKSLGVAIDVAGPFSLDIDSVGRNILAMAVSGFVFFLLTLLIEYKFFLPLLACNKNIDVSNVKEREGEDEDVARERKRISRGRARDSILRLENLAKVYKSPFSTSKVLAVDGLSLGVTKGECFGLLGVNGAGKTSTFKMLTGDVSVTAGNALVLGHSVTSDIHSVRRNVGYCPQFDAINDLLTGREHLTLYARLKGVAEKEVPQVVEWCLRKLALTQYAGVCAGKYSGGNKRKLSAAIALIGQPAVVFLDEPTTGMDPKSRRFLWSVISNLIQQGCSIILTSHSMEECEALCTRIGIMVNGQLKCLGSPLHLKSRFGDGYTVTVRVAGSFPDLEPVKTFFSTTFPGADLKEQQHNMLEYQLPSGCAPLSVVFSQLETGKEKLNIHDYSISQTTLDRVFVHFAKRQGDGVSSGESRKSLWGRFRAGFISAHQKRQGGSVDAAESSNKALWGRFRVAFNARKQQVQLEDNNDDPEAVHLVQDQDESIA